MVIWAVPAAKRATQIAHPSTGRQLHRTDSVVQRTNNHCRRHAAVTALGVLSVGGAIVYMIGGPTKAAKKAGNAE
jgi:hypothetical protein